MTRKQRVIRTLICVLVISCSFSSLAHAGWEHKLARGIINILVSPAEITKHMMIEALHAKPDYLGSIYGVFYGSFKGAGHAAARFSSGVCDFFTFWLNRPEGWVQLIPLDPFTYKEDASWAEEMDT